MEEDRREDGYDVHLYALVRVKVMDLSASSPQEAIREALARTDLHRLFATLDSFLPLDTSVEYAEEILGYLVDDRGDEEHGRSRYYCRHARPAEFGPRDCDCEEEGGVRRRAGGKRRDAPPPADPGPASPKEARPLSEQKLERKK